MRRKNNSARQVVGVFSPMMFNRRDCFGTQGGRRRSPVAGGRNYCRLPHLVKILWRKIISNLSTRAYVSYMRSTAVVKSADPGIDGLEFDGSYTGDSVFFVYMDQVALGLLSGKPSFHKLVHEGLKIYFHLC